MTKLWRITVGAALVVFSIGLGVTAGAPLASAQASPCPPGQPDGRPPGQPPSSPGQPNGRPPQYPPGRCNLALSRGSVARGEKVTVFGAGYAPGSAVDLTLHSDPIGLATVTSGADGSFTADVTIPLSAPLGQHTVEAAGTAPGGDPMVLSASLEVTDAAAASRGSTAPRAAVGSTSGGSSSGLAFTGLEIGLMTALGVGLVAVGSAAVLGARRRRIA